MVPDDILIRQFNKGNGSAFQLIYDRFYGMLLMIAYKLINDRDECEDLISEVFHSAYDKRTTFNTIGHLKGFLLITVKNKCYNHLDHLTRVRKYVSSLKEEVEENVEALIVKAEFLQMVYEAIERLLPYRKRIFKMYYIEGLTNEEIATELNTTIDYVYTVKNKALKDLKGYIKLS